jgi:hypothetical protein
VITILKDLMYFRPPHLEPFMNIKDTLSLKPTLLVTIEIGELDIGPSITKGKLQGI